MHEMSIAQSVLDIAFGEMDKNAAKRLKKIKISIGEFSGVVKEALDFAFNVLARGTRAEDAEIEVEVVALRSECPVCGQVACKLTDLNLQCPTCGETVRITAGRDMKVDYLDIE